MVEAQLGLEVVALKIKGGVVYWKLSDGKFYDELPITLLPSKTEETKDA